MTAEQLIRIAIEMQKTIQHGMENSINAAAIDVLSRASVVQLELALRDIVEQKRKAQP